MAKQKQKKRRLTKATKRKIIGIFIGGFLAIILACAFIIFYAIMQVEVVDKTSNLYAGINANAIEQSSGYFTLNQLKQFNKQKKTKLKITKSDDKKRITEITGILSDDKVTDSQKAFKVLVSMRDIFEITEYKFTYADEMHSGDETTYAFEQLHDGMKILGYHFDIVVKNEKAVTIRGQFYHLPDDFVTEPKITKDGIREKMQCPKNEVPYYIELVILTNSKEPRLAWRGYTKFKYSVKKETLHTVWTDATTGKTIATEDGKKDQPTVQETDENKKETTDRKK